jgi:quinol monooxygenase YgiN
LHVEDPHKFVLTEVWDSKEHYEKYAAFRVEDGTVAAISNMCVDGPNIDIFDITDA